MSAPAPLNFIAGDRVEYRAAFLRSIGWVTGVTTGLVVVSVQCATVTVQAPDGRRYPVLASNLIHRHRLHLEAP